MIQKNSNTHFPAADKVKALEVMQKAGTK